MVMSKFRSMPSGAQRLGALLGYDDAHLPSILSLFPHASLFAFYTCNPSSWEFEASLGYIMRKQLKNNYSPQTKKYLKTSYNCILSDFTCISNNFRKSYFSILEYTLKNCWIICFDNSIICLLGSLQVP
jgi:hypothetical protein